MAQSAAKARQESIYSVHPGVAMVQKWIAGLSDKTGKTLEEWIELVKESGPATENERREWLKAKHKFGTNEAWWIAARADGKEMEEGDPEAYLKAAGKYVEEMYAGPKAGLRLIYEKLLKLGRSMGDDVRVCPCKTIVPFAGTSSRRSSPRRRRELISAWR